MCARATARLLFVHCGDIITVCFDIAKGNIFRRKLSFAFQVKPKHLSCIGVCCFLLAARIVEEECNVPSTHDVIRISQCKCTASDIKRMEQIISEKLHYELEATTALNFLHLYHAIVLCHTSERSVKFCAVTIAIAKRNELECQWNSCCYTLDFEVIQDFGHLMNCHFSVLCRKDILSLDKLEAQLKACNCRLVFSKAKVSWLLVDMSHRFYSELVENVYYYFLLLAISISSVPSQFGSRNFEIRWATGNSPTC